MADRRPVGDKGAQEEIGPSDRLLTEHIVRTDGGELVLEDSISGAQPLSNLVGGGGGGNHSTLINLGNDDHLQYHNDARGDARYPQVTPTPGDDEFLMSDGTITAVRGSGAFGNELLGVGVIGDADNLVVDAGGGNVDIVAHTAMVKETDSELAKVVRIAVAGFTGIAIPLDQRRFLGVDYNGGTPIAIVATDDDSFNLTTQYPVATVSRDSGGVHITPLVVPLTRFTSRFMARLYSTNPLAYDSGLLLNTSGAGGDHVFVSSGALWVLLSRTEYFGPGPGFVDFDTFVSDTVNVWTGSPGTFGEQTGLTLYPQDQYNDGTATPATLGNNRFGNIWWYMDAANGEILGFLGVSNAQSSATAEAEDAPTQDALPPRLVNTILIGRFIIQESQPLNTVVEIAWLESNFKGGPVQSHSQLADLTVGDDHTQYQLRSEQGMAGGYPTLNGGAYVNEAVTRVFESNPGTVLDIGALAVGESMARGFGVTATNIVGRLIPEVSHHFLWQYDQPNTADADPGSGYFRLNNTDPALATFVYVSHEVAEWAVDVEDSLLHVASGDRLFLGGTSRVNDDTAAYYSVTGNPVAATGYVKIPVSFLDQATNKPSNVNDDQIFSLSFSKAGGGGGGGARAMTFDFRTRTTTVFGIGTTPAFINFDQTDNAIDSSFMTFASGTWTAQKAFSAVIITEATFDWNSGTAPEVGVDIVVNASIQAGTKQAEIYSTLMQTNGLTCMAFYTFAVNDTLRMYWYTNSGSVNLRADTPKTWIIPMETI